MARPDSLNTTFTASLLNDAAPSLSPLGSHPFTLHRRSHTGVEVRRRTEGTLERPYSGYDFQNVRSSLYAGDLHDTMLLGERIRAQRARDDIAALVDFLKNHPPPPDNYMSRPYEDDEDSRGRWSKIRKIGRRSKSMPKQQQHIRLPDSAVVGVTTGGHRHIAISIPLEATPDGDDMRTQYPVFSYGTQPGTMPKKLIKTFKNEKGVVTVLRPVTEVYETDGGLAVSRRPSYKNSQGRCPPPLPPHKPTNSLTGQTQDYLGALPAGFDTPLLDDKSAPWHISRAPSRSEGSLRKQNSPAFHRSAYPARASSMTANRSAGHAASIDGRLSSQDQRTAASSTSRPRDYPDLVGPVPRRPHSTNHDTSANETRHEPRRSKSGRLRDGREVSQGLGQTNGQICNATPMADSPLLSQAVESRPTTSGSTRSRKELVRDRKRRDMDAAKRNTNKKAQQKTGTPSAHQISTGCTPSPPPPPPAPAQQSIKETSNSEAGQSTLTLSSLMVVVNVEPCSADEADLPAQPKTTAAKKTKVTSAEGGPTPVPIITVNSPSIPTPPTSTQGSPQQKHGASDRTSLTRRREWKAIREQERKARDAMAVARAKAQQLASGGVTYENGGISQADKEVMRLYEAYREHRLRDMERRLRRLERNGDIWLQALVPVLDNMNQTMAAANEQPLQDFRDWASDDETSGTARRSGGDVEKRRLTRRSSLSQGRLLEKLTGHGFDDDTWSDSVSRSDDASGLGTIEPLMRELAGEARRFQSTTQPPVITNGGYFHAM